MQSRLRLMLSSIIYMITGTITVKNYNVIVRHVNCTQACNRLLCG